MRTLQKISLPAVLVALLAGGCGNGSDAASGGGEPSDGSASASASASEASGSAPTSSDTAPSAPSGQDNVLTVKTATEEHEFTPNIVRCSGEPGHIGHLIASVDNQPPLFRVAGEEFVMYKPQQQGPPYQTDDPANIEFTDEGVVAEGTQAGDATITGELHCTEWEND